MSIELRLAVTENGNTWHLYAVDFPTDDGTFSVYLYALDDGHAAMMLDDMKAGATLRGRIVSTEPGPTPT